jgi:hypothetical protein
LEQYQKQDGEDHVCKNKGKCLLKQSTVLGRGWMLPGKSNYQVRKNGVMCFHHYCCACYTDWHYKVHQSERLIEENIYLKATVEQQADEIAQLQRLLQIRNHLTHAFSTARAGDYQLFK